MGTQDVRAQAPASPKLLDHVRDAIRMRHYSYRTEETYVHAQSRSSSAMTASRLR